VCRLANGKSEKDTTASIGSILVSKTGEAPRYNDAAMPDQPQKGQVVLLLNPSIANTRDTA